MFTLTKAVSKSRDYLLILAVAVFGVMIGGSTALAHADGEYWVTGWNWYSLINHGEPNHFDWNNLHYSYDHEVKAYHDGGDDLQFQNYKFTNVSYWGTGDPTAWWGPIKVWGTSGGNYTDYTHLCEKLGVDITEEFIQIFEDMDLPASVNNQVWVYQGGGACSEPDEWTNWDYYVLES